MANPTLAIVNQAKLEARLSASIVERILDDDNTGVPNPAPLAQLLSDGQSWVMGYVRRAYSAAECAQILAAPPELLVSLCLDACQIFAYERFPTYCRQPSQDMYKRLQDNLDRIATSRIRFDGITGNAQDPLPANVGGIMESGNPKNSAPVPAVFSNGMGDF